MDTNGDLGIMSHVGHLHIYTHSQNLSEILDREMLFLVIGKFHKISQMSHQMSHL